MLLNSMSLFAAVPGWVQPLWIVPAGIAGALLLMSALYGLLCLLAPRVAAIARITAHEALVLPLFWVELAIGFVLLVVFTYMPYVTFGDDVKMMKETSLTTVMVLTALLGIWTASVSIADEIEGRTALTLLSKPVTRLQFILGKFLGILTPVALMYIFLGGVLLAGVSYKVVFEAIIPMSPAAQAATCQNEMLLLVTPLALAFLEVVVLTSIATALSTRLTMLSNLMVSLAIYFVGHLVPLLVQSRQSQHQIVNFMGKLLATVLPVLDHFSVKAKVATGSVVPLDYLGWSAGYAALYSAIAVLVALLLFEERDLG